ASQIDAGRRNELDRLIVQSRLQLHLRLRQGLTFLRRRSPWMIAGLWVGGAAALALLATVILTYASPRGSLLPTSTTKAASSTTSPPTRAPIVVTSRPTTAPAAAGAPATTVPARSTLPPTQPVATAAAITPLVATATATASPLGATVYVAHTDGIGI